MNEFCIIDKELRCENCPRMLSMEIAMDALKATTSENIESGFAVEDEIRQSLRRGSLSDSEIDAFLESPAAQELVRQHREQQALSADASDWKIRQIEAKAKKMQRQCSGPAVGTATTPDGQEFEVAVCGSPALGRLRTHEASSIERGGTGRGFGSAVLAVFERAKHAILP